MKTIPLTRGKEAIIDDEDYERVNSETWYASDHQGHYMATRINTVNGVKTKLYLGRFILGETDPKILVMHKNGNSLDCRRNNLVRISTTEAYTYRLRANYKLSPIYRTKKRQEAQYAEMQ